MKKIFNRRTYILLFSFIMLSLTTAISFAQDSAASSGSATRSVTTATTEHPSTVPTWVWIVGGVILLSIIIALLSRNKGDVAGRTDRVTYTKTTSRDTNV